MDFVTIENAELGQTARVPAIAVQHLGKGWTVVEGEVVTDDVPEPFDPSEHTVAEVQEHLAYATPEERDRVLELEQNGKARAGVVG